MEVARAVSITTCNSTSVAIATISVGNIAATTAASTREAPNMIVIFALADDLVLLLSIYQCVYVT